MRSPSAEPSTPALAGPRTRVGGQSGKPRPTRMLWITAAWGACFITIRWGLRDAPILWFASLRSIVAGVALVAVGTAQRRPIP